MGDFIFSRPWQTPTSGGADTLRTPIAPGWEHSAIQLAYRAVRAGRSRAERTSVIFTDVMHNRQPVPLFLGAAARPTDAFLGLGHRDATVHQDESLRTC